MLLAQTELDPSQKKQYALEILQEIDPEGWYIVNKVNNLAANNHFDRYIRGNQKQDIRDALGTIVHELNHGYSALMAWKLRPRELDKFLCYYISDTTHVLVKRTTIFPTEEMGKTINKNLQTFRFDTYVYKAGEPIRITSNTLGIYGLLDEWIAYYHGTKTDVNMYKWYQKNTKGTVKDWYNYFSTVGSVINAYIEFKFYCLSYLLFARQHKPIIYKNILENHSFVEVFLTIDKLYGDLVRKYVDVKSEILQGLKDKGVTVNEDNEWIVMNGQGVGNFVKEYKVLENEIKKPHYQEMLQMLKASLPLNQSSQP